ncbi:molybdopterin-dependent oxidoreductase [Rhizobium sp. L1K21]|uniref:molybdopterin-dependent oxidoreductase n=1 Tax=Rhizobium sp. L1K21 TaxID=2954933 RepID=UPI00209238CA|nr:molybdopterin-dependent oxidoreductase [Rhizobium sp. L1K21]MCO6187513.1 molybdopterin-dependent oxidoreductase [Rhizobium sp. L1K21]
MKLAFLSLLFSGVAFFASPLQAMEAPTGRVILTVKGNVENTNSEGAAKFDLAMLEALAGRSATMETPWTEGEVTFSGPYLRSILEAAGASGHKLIVRALNDYAADVPFEDGKLDVIMATRKNGSEMPVRDKGPLFLVYPFDLDKSLYSEKIFARSVWQIKEIEVVE